MRGGRGRGGSRGGGRGGRVSYGKRSRSDASAAPTRTHYTTTTMTTTAAAAAQSDAYKPFVTDNVISNDNNGNKHDTTQARASSTSTTAVQQLQQSSPPSSSSSTRPARHGTSSTTRPRDVVVILAKAGLLLGAYGLVDAHERAASTTLANTSLLDVRPDIVHQCLLALFDSDLAHAHRLRVYVHMYARHGSVDKVVEVSPALRPPRTFTRFCGLMSTLLRDGRVCAADGQVLMRVLPGSIAPVLPHGVTVTGISNARGAPVRTAMQLAAAAAAAPVPDTLQGGIKHVAAYYCVACTDDGSLDGVDYVTEQVCLSAYPASAHVQCARVCEAHARIVCADTQQETTSGASRNTTATTTSEEEAHAAITATSSS